MTDTISRNEHFYRFAAGILCGALFVALLVWRWPLPKVTAQACTFSLSSTGQTFAAGGGMGSLALAASSLSCSWTALSNAPWVAIVSSASGAGSASVRYSVAPNPTAASRSGSLTIAGQTFAVNQAPGLSGLQFFPLAHPVRLLDTRVGASGCYHPDADIPGGTSRTQPARGTCDGLTIPANAAAITGNITTVQSGGGYLTLYPSDAAQPTVANSNYGPNEILNNVFTVGLGNADGAFKIFVTSNTDIVIDVTGYYAPPATGGLYFHPLPKPVRLLDTRNGATGCTTPNAPLPGGVDSVQGAHLACDGVTIPASAKAVVGNATTVSPQGPGFPYLTLFPADATRPLVASSNYLPGQVMNAPFTVGLSAAGQFKIFPTTQTELVVDVLGYYSGDAVDVNGAGLLFTPLPRPVRLLDTRGGATGCYAPNAALEAGSTRTQPARGVCDGVTVAAEALGIVGNATVVNAAGGYLTFWPSSAAQPLVATSNFALGQVFNRHFTVGLGAGDGAFKIYTYQGTDLVVDVSGYFAPPPANQPPLVTAGANQTLAPPTTTASLTGAASDDGLPLGALTVSWSKVSGPGAVTFSQPSQVATDATFGAEGVYELRLTASDGALTATDDVQVTVNGPLTVNAGGDQVVTLPNQATLMGAVTGGSGTALVSWGIVSGPGPVLFSSASATVTAAIFQTNGEYVLRLTAVDGQTAAADDVQVTVNADPTPPPPDPATVALAVDTTVATTVGASTEFLYTGANPIQSGVAPGTINPARAAVLRGRVLDKNNNPLSLVKVTILNHPEYGQTRSRADGRFDLAVNGGGLLNVQYEKVGFITAQRQESVPWQEYMGVPDVVLIGYDPQVTLIDLGADVPIQVARGSANTDGSGSRKSTLLFAQGTTALMKLPGGAVAGLDKLHVRATEFTVGANGPQTMPAELPPSSGYTYALEYSVDEAVAAGATDVIFSQPVISYEENFLGFPAGLNVPAGYYDRANGRWAPEASGLVVKVLSISGGAANLDVTGMGQPATQAQYDALGITLAERQQLAALYAADQSLWRTALTHFSAWDKNWGFGPPANAKPPKMPKPKPKPRPDKPTTCDGCILRAEVQTLGESVDLVGTPFSLNYESGRVPGRKEGYNLEIPLTDATLPAEVIRINLEVTVAGRTFAQSFPRQTDLTTTFTWDGKDAYGRTVQGTQNVGVSIGYAYQGVYQQTNNFGYNGNGISITGVPTRQEVSLNQASVTSLGAWDARGSGLGGWTLDVHHTYDPTGQILYLGTGDRRTIQGARQVISTVAGGVSQDCFTFPQLCQDGAPATQVAIGAPHQIAVDAAGNVYVVEADFSKVRKVTPAGLVYTVAGTFAFGYNGDNIPATSAQLNIGRFVGGVAADSQGNVYISDYGNWRIRKVNAAGIITTFAGTGVQADECADPQNPCPPRPAVSAKLCGPGRLTLDRSGNLYVLDCNRIKKIDPAGNLSTVVYLASSTPAVDTQGNLYYSDFGGTRVVKLSPDGQTTVIAGGNNTGTTGDGGLATQAQIECASVTLDRQGNLYISQGCNTGFDRVRMVTPDGIINTFAGGTRRFYGGDGGTPLAAGFNALLNVVEDSLGNLYIGDSGAGNPGSIRKVASALPSFTSGEILIPSEDGQEVYVFNPFGRHLRTLHALTGAILYQFSYDSAGQLAGVTDGDNKVTTVQRNGSGTATAIVSPYGQSTALTINANGFLTGVTDPANQSYQFSYTSDGLMTGMIDPRSNAYSFTYDNLGRLTRDDDPAGGFQTLARMDPNLKSYTVTRNTALNRTETFQVQTLANEDLKRINTDTAGLQTQSVEGINGLNTAAFPDEVMTSVQLDGDPRWKMLAPLPKSSSITTPGGLTFNSTFARTATLSNTNNLFSLTAQNDTLTINGRIYTSNYSAAARTFTLTTPAGRQATAIIDTQGRTTLSQLASLDPANFTYDAQGRLATAVYGTAGSARNYSYTYDAAGFLSSVTDPLSRVTSFVYDAAGRVTQQTLPGGRVIAYSYDASGNLTSIIPPGRPAHVFSYTPVNLASSYAPPAVAGTGPTTYAFNLDRQLTTITRPDSQTLTLSYDAAGRLSTLAIPGGQYGYTYDATTGNLTGITAPGGQTLAFTYDGALLTQAAWAGAVAGSVGYTYDNDFRVTSQSVNGANTISFTYDNDSLLTGAGALALARNAQNGLVNGTTLGSVTTALGYNGFAEVTAHSAAFNGSGLYDCQYTYDKLGRITQKVESIQGGAATTYDYAYDAAGRLTGVTLNGAPTPANTYTYDQNGNRTSASIGGVVTNGTYDNQDRLTQYGSATYAYTANGELQSKTVGAQTTQYSYDVLGNLKAVTLPGSTQIEYVIDGQDRRAGKKVNGTLTQGFLYQGRLNPIAELDGANNVVSRFVYASRANVPDYMIKGGATYRLISDHLGSVRLVVDTATGAIAQRLDYDEFGNVTLDSAPGFQPFGFAGGLYDKDTGLVRFGARDYDAQTGRWTAKDPILFAGGDTNLYGYVMNDPVNLVDPSGLCSRSEKEKEEIKEKNAEVLKYLKILAQALGLDPIEIVSKTLGKALVPIDLIIQIQEAVQVSPLERATIKEAYQGLRGALGAQTTVAR